MATRWIEQFTGALEGKRRWHRYKARKEQLPPSYRTTVDGLERYLVHAGAISDGDVLMQMLEDLADLVEGAAADDTPVRDVVGDDPVAFADDFMRNYAEGQWIDEERRRLTDAMDRADRAEVADGSDEGGRT